MIRPASIVLVITAIMPVINEIKPPFDPPPQHSAVARDLPEGSQEFSIGGDSSYSVRWHHIAGGRGSVRVIKVVCAEPSISVTLHTHGAASDVTREALAGSLRIVSTDTFLEIAADPRKTICYTVRMTAEHDPRPKWAPFEVDHRKRAMTGEKESIRVGGDPPQAQIRHLRLERPSFVTLRAVAFGRLPHLDVLTQNRKVIGHATTGTSTLLFRRNLPAGEYVLRIAPTSTDFSTVTLSVTVAAHDAGFTRRR